MENKNHNRKKTKNKSQKSVSPQLAAQPSYVYKNSKKKDVNFTDKCKIGKQNVLHPVSEPKVYQDSSYEFSSKSCCEVVDEYDSTSDFFKPVFYHDKNKSFESKNHFEGIAMKEEIFSSVNQYKNSKVSFSKVYHKWLPERQNTLEKLKSLLIKVHDNSAEYHTTQATFKELSYNSRRCKEATENQAVDFFASLTAFVSDAVSGISSFAQACEVDSYQTTFREIMDHDAEITKVLYNSRSQCLLQYQGIEEVIRKFHSSTLASTVDKISDTLHLEKHLTVMKYAYEKNDMSKLLDEVCKLIDNVCQSEVLENVGDSVRRYVSDNPAALEACKSTGKAVYGAIDTFREKKRNRNSAIGYVNEATNFYLMLEDKKEVDYHRSLIDDDTHQSKLESQIKDAIDSLEAEMKEMNNVYFQLYNIYDSD